MLTFSQALRSQLSTSVGNRRESDPLDVINTRRNFASLGIHSDDTQRPVIDQELDSSIRGFQRNKGLKEDGLMNPGGETERALNRDLSRIDEINVGRTDLFAPLLSLSAPVGNNKINRNQDVQQVQRGLGGLGFSSEAALFEPSGIIDRETVDGVLNFQRQNDLRVDGFLGPGGETETALNQALTTLNEEDGGDDGEDPEKPDEPEDPEKPDEPEDPKEPEDPEDPKEPEDPEDPEEPEDPEDPEEPEDPEDPEEPEDPEDPEEPEDPEAPDCSDLETALEEATATLDAANTALDTAESEKSQLEASIERAESALREKEQIAASIESKIGELEALQKEENKDRFKSKIFGKGFGKVTGSRGGRIGSEIGGAIGGKVGPIIEEINDAMSGRKTDSQIAQEISALSNQLSALQADIETLRQTIEEPRARIDELESEIASSLQPAVDEASSVVESLQSALEKCQGEEG